MTRLHTIDIIIIARCLVLHLFIDLYKFKQVKNTLKYSLVKRYILILVSVFISAEAALDAVKKNYFMRFVSILTIVNGPLLWLITVKLFADNISTFKKASYKSICDITSFRYTILSILIFVMIINAQMNAVGSFLNSFVDIPHLQEMTLVFNTLIMYSVFSRVRAIDYILVTYALIVFLIEFTIRIQFLEISYNITSFHLVKGITVLVLTMMFTTIILTTDSLLNTKNALYTCNITKKLFTRFRDKQTLLLARIPVLNVCMFVIFFDALGKSLMRLTWLISNFWKPIIFTARVAEFLGLQTHQKSFRWGILGILGTLVGRYIADKFTAVSTLFGTINSTIGLFSTHYWQVTRLNKYYILTYKL